MGRISDDVRDPPGQQSISSSRRSLLLSGFYFTGFLDRVKCFACGMTVQQWQENDNPADRRWHKKNCPFLRGEDCGNVPIGGHVNQFYGNLSTRSSPRNPGEEVIQQRDPVTGAIIRTVRYPADLPERIRQTGGTFEIGPNNQVTIRSGPGAAGMRRPGLQQAPARLPPSPFQQSQHQPMRQWRMANVISADHKRFLTNLYLNRELDRVASFARWPTGRPNVAPAALAKTGFFYLGDMDRTQCFSCGGVLRNWTADDDAVAEHHAHSPNCRFLLGTDTRNVPVSDLPVPPEERERDFPCRFPSNPHMRSEAARLETFDQRWPRERTAATLAEIAQAGFFYLGERDRVKCWYCNGGLQHWDYDDVPWIEHAKWFPNCQFLLSVKGQHFVYRHLAMSPQLPRPRIARQDGSPLEPRVEQSPSQPPEDIQLIAAGVQQPSPPPTIIAPQEEMKKKRQRIDDVMKKSDLVKNVLAMGFSDQIVRQLLVEKVELGTEESADDIYGSTVALLDDVMKREEELKQEEEQRSSVAAAAPSVPGPSTSYIPSIPSVYSSMSSSFSSLGPAPGTGKYNVSYFGDEDEESGSEILSCERDYGNLWSCDGGLHCMPTTAARIQQLRPIAGVISQQADQDCANALERIESTNTYIHHPLMLQAPTHEVYLAFSPFPQNAEAYLVGCMFPFHVEEGAAVQEVQINCISFCTFPVPLIPHDDEGEPQSEQEFFIRPNHAMVNKFFPQDILVEGSGKKNMYICHILCI